MNGVTKSYGMIGEFTTAAAVLHAAQKVRDAGFRKWDVVTPFPVHGMDKAMGLKDSHLGWNVLPLGLTGTLSAFAMMYWMNGIDYPLNVGGKPFFGWPQFVPITWELLVLTAALTGLIGFLALCGLPMPYHPVFNVPQFARASQDRFFLVIEAVDPQYHPDRTREFLATLTPVSIAEVPE